MAIRISTSIKNALMADALASPGAEICGLLLGNADAVLCVQAVPNVSKTPSAQFELDPAKLIAALRAEREGGDSVLGYYHSHPNGLPYPSETDARMAMPDGKLWVIVTPASLSAWRAAEAGEHLGRFDPEFILPC